MKHEPIKFDVNGNFILSGDIERQWMKLHRDIQKEYRAEQWHAFWTAMACVGGALSIAYLGLTTFAYWIG